MQSKKQPLCTECTLWPAACINQECGNSGAGSTGPKNPIRRWMPFSAGQRDCIGQNLARMNYVTTVAMLLAKFSMKLAVPVSCFLSTTQPKGYAWQE